MVAVKADIGTPPRENPDHGRLQCSVELSASADPAYEGRGGESLGVELGKSLERSLLGASAGGRVPLRRRQRRARRHRARRAPRRRRRARHVPTLHSTRQDLLAPPVRRPRPQRRRLRPRRPLRRRPRRARRRAHPQSHRRRAPNPDDPAELELDDDPEECSRLDISGVPLIVTLTRVGAHAVVDATEDEETHAAAGVSVAVDAQGRVRAVGKRGGGGIDLGVVRGMMKTARDVGKKLIAAVDGFLLAAESGAGEGKTPTTRWRRDGGVFGAEARADDGAVVVIAERSRHRVEKSGSVRVSHTSSLFSVSLAPSPVSLIPIVRSRGRAA